MTKEEAEILEQKVRDLNFGETTWYNVNIGYERTIGGWIHYTYDAMNDVITTSTFIPDNGLTLK